MKAKPPPKRRRFANDWDEIRRLHEISHNTPHQDLVLKDYGYDDLSDRLELLATLHHDSGSLNKAITILKASKRLCDAHGISLMARTSFRSTWKKKGIPRRMRKKIPRLQRSGRRERSSFRLKRS